MVGFRKTIWITIALAIFGIGTPAESAETKWSGIPASRRYWGNSKGQSHLNPIEKNQIISYLYGRGEQCKLEES